MSTDMNITRPTSRVLRPPGGGSSNIFGTDEPAAAPAPRAARPAPAPVPVSEPVRRAPAPAPVAAPAPAPAAGGNRRQPPGGQSSIVFG